MFNKISIKGGIKTTDGRVLHQNNTYSFEEGITAITGPNGSGKSLLAEFCAFSLFGVCALRLSSEHYKGLEVEAEVTIKGNKYLIKRAINNCIIYVINNSGQPLEACKGTKACNEYIIKVLGYNYQVYSMGNYAAQGEISDFCKLKPSERKSAIDKVLGLGVIDILAKAAYDSGKEYADEARGMESVIGPEPIAPTRPDTKGLSEEQLNDLLKATQSVIDRRNTLTEMLQQIESKLVAPVEPVKPENYMPSDKIRELLSKKTFCESELIRYNQYKKPEYSKEYLKNIPLEWEAYRAYQEYKLKLSLMPEEKPSIPLEEALNGCTDWYNYNVYLAKKKALEKEQVTCPKCGNVFIPSGKHEDLKQILSQPDKDENFYKTQVELHHIWEGISEPEPVPEAPLPAVTEGKAAKLLNEYDMYEEGQAKLPDLMKEYETCCMVTELGLKNAQEYEKNLAYYETYKDVYQQRLIERDNYQKELEQIKALGDIDGTKLVYNNLLISLSNYNVLLSSYEVSIKSYKEKMKEIKKGKDLGERYKKASENLKEMKVKIKRYVIPSLQKVSSRLLYEMSDGLYDSIEIDDDFNITSKGMDVAGYSGSEKDMINLAVRIGLGQVLTHKAFNVFVGDEIDAAMSPERAQKVTDCLGRLKKYIKQIILVSHRQIVADNYIKLN